MTAAWIETTRQFVETQMTGDHTGHDWWHVYRVWRTAIHLMNLEISAGKRIDPLVVELATLLHDMWDHKAYSGDETVAPREVRRYLEQLGVDEARTDHIVTIIKDLSFKGAGVATPMHSHEGMIVQDADRLDAIGAVGIARTFAYGGAKGRAIYDPKIAPDAHQDFDRYKNSTAPTLNHFYEKLLLLKDRMNTDAAKQTAIERHAFMEQFLKRFYDEWEGEA